MRGRLLVIVGFVASSAWPCSLAGEAPKVEFVSPAHGSREVPVNAEVKLVLSNSASQPAGAFALRDVDSGVEVPLRVTTVVDTQALGGTLLAASVRLVRLQPTQPLAEHRTWSVTWGGREVTRFGSGAVKDTTRPGAPGRLTSSRFEAAESTCFGATRRYDLEFEPASDEGTPQGQLVYLARLEGGRQAVLFPGRLQLGQTQGEGNLVFNEATSLEGTLEALDWAGNAGPTQALNMSPGLAGTDAAQWWRLLGDELQVFVTASCSLCTALGGALVLVLRARRKLPGGAGERPPSP